MTQVARSFRLMTVVPFILLLARVPSANAQTPDQRAALTRFRDSLGSLADIAALEALRDRFAATLGGDAASRLRLGTVDHRLGELTGARKYFDAAIGDFAESARRHPEWAEAWYGMGLAKLELHDAGFSAKEGPYQRVGTDYLHGAADAFIQALEMDPGFAGAAERLATSVLRETIQPQVTEALGPLRRAASGPGSAKSAVQMSRGLIEREAGHGDSALAAFDRFLQLGGDSGVGSLERARTLFDLGRAGEAQVAYFAGAGLATSTAALAHYRSDLAWIATPEELARFDATTFASRAAWLGDFWRRRDVQDGRGAGERLAEHYRRLFYVMRKFRLVSEQQQRATLRAVRSPLLDKRSPTIEDGLRALVRNLASKEQQLAGGGPVTAPQHQDAAAAPTDALSEAYAQLNDQTLLRAYRSDQHVVDDRGVIYMRHGEPLKRAAYPGADTDPNESWLYETTARAIVFHFTGVAAPTTLVEQLPLNPALLASRSGLDPRYERMADDAGKYRLQPTALQQDRVRGRQAIAVGTRTDSYALRFDRQTKTVVQAFGVRDGLDGQGRLLVVIAAKGKDLRYRRVGADSVIAYPVSLRIIARNAETGAVHRLDTTRTFATRRVLREDEFLTAQAQIPVPAGRYVMQAIVADDGWHAGAAIRQDSLVVPDLQAARLTMSDLVLGRVGSGQHWIASPDTVALNPLNAYPAGSSMEVYYQVGGMKAGHTYETRIEVRTRGGKGDRVTANFREEGRAAKAVQFRTMVLGKLSPGEYLLILTLQDVDGSVSVSRQQSLNVTKG